MKEKIIRRCRNNFKNRRKRKNRHPYTHIHDRSLFWLSTCILIENHGGVKLALWTQTSALGEMSNNTVMQR